MKSIYSKDHRNVALQIKKARLESNLSQQQAANILNKTQSYISKVESGQRRMDIAEIKQFAKAYKKDVSFFIK